MEEYKKISRRQIDEMLSGVPLKLNRALSLALVLGPTLFLAVVLFLYQDNLSSDVEVFPNVVDELIAVFLIFALTVYLMFSIFPKIFLKGNKLETQLNSPHTIEKIDPVIAIINLDRTMMIIRLAMIEGVTLFSLVILILCVNSGIIYYNDNYWLLVLPLLFQMVITIQFVSLEKTISRIERDILFRIKNENY